MKLTPTQRKNLIPLILFLANLVFLYIGGLIFESIEHEPRKKHTTRDDVALFLQTLKKTSLGKQILPKDFDSKEVVKELKPESLKNFDTKFEEIRNDTTAASKPSWSFSNSLFFATTVVTTIGKPSLNLINLSLSRFYFLYFFSHLWGKSSILNESCTVPKILKDTVDATGRLKTGWIEIITEGFLHVLNLKFLSHCFPNGTNQQLSTSTQHGVQTRRPNMLVNSLLGVHGPVKQIWLIFRPLSVEALTPERNVWLACSHYWNYLPLI